MKMTINQGHFRLFTITKGILGFWYVKSLLLLLLRNFTWFAQRFTAMRASTAATLIRTASTNRVAASLCDVMHYRDCGHYSRYWLWSWDMWLIFHVITGLTSENIFLFSVYIMVFSTKLWIFLRRICLQNILNNPIFSLIVKSVRIWEKGKEWNWFSFI